MLYKKSMSKMIERKMSLVISDVDDSERVELDPCKLTPVIHRESEKEVFCKCGPTGSVEIPKT